MAFGHSTKGEALRAVKRYADADIRAAGGGSFQNEFASSFRTHDGRTVWIGHALVYLPTQGPHWIKAT